MSSGTELKLVGSENPNLPFLKMMRISLLVPPFLTVSVYSPVVRVESRTRNVPSGVSLSLLATSSLWVDEDKIMCTDIIELFAVYM